MTHDWDEFSKSLAEESVPRRESLRRLGAVFAGAVLSPLSMGLGSAWAARTADPCKAFCKCRNKSQQNACLAACKACNKDTSRLCGGCGSYACCATACCGGACVDVLDDFNNCGGCGNACDPPGPYEEGLCYDGTCRYQCVSGALLCNGACTPVLWDPNNCGACGNVCGGAAPFCNQGACSSCPGGTTDCSGHCVFLDHDLLNCGACGMVCGPGEECYGGACHTAEPPWGDATY